MRPALAALMLCCLPLPAAAASFDCSAASGRRERMICADAALSAADSDLGDAFAAALAASPHPQALRADQRQWITETRNKAATPTEMLAAYRSRTGELGRRTAEWQATREDLAATPPSQCVKLLDAGACTVTELGTLADAPGGPLRYRLQSWRDGDRTVGTAVIVLASSGAQTRAVTWSADEDAWYEAPTIEPTPQGPILDLPGHLSGTGNFSAETIFAWRDGGWREIDATSWLGQLSERLPKGAEVWKGVYPNWRTMSAQTPLWGPGDGNCCPRAGSATAALRLEGERIVLVSLFVSARPLADQ